MKRFTDTNLNREPWYRKLKPRLKCAVRFLFDECNAAGIWVIDMETMSYFVGEEVTLDELLPAVNSDKDGRIEIFNNDKIFIPGFIEFQYGQLSEACKPHIKIIALLNKYNLLERVYKGYTKGTRTLQEEEEDKDGEEVKDGRGPGGRSKRPLKKAAEGQRQEILKAAYQTMQEEMTGEEDKVVFGKIKLFVEAERPSFADPYVEAWNIFATLYGLECVKEITADRREKIKTRAREPGFEFFKMLAVIRERKWYRGDNDRGWKVTFNYLIESEKKYTEIIEKYAEH